jgi:hypothetical protein
MVQSWICTQCFEKQIVEFFLMWSPIAQFEKFFNESMWLIAYTCRYDDMLYYETEILIHCVNVMFQ